MPSSTSFFDCKKLDPHLVMVRSSSDVIKEFSIIKVSDEKNNKSN